MDNSNTYTNYIPIKQQEIESDEFNKEEDETNKSNETNKTKEDIVKIYNKIKSIDRVRKSTIQESKTVEENNTQMMMIVEEFEKTINHLVVEKEREEVCQQIVMERLDKGKKKLLCNLFYSRILDERNDVVMDHQNVERAFADLNHKYERTKEVVAGMQMDEDNLKHSVDSLNRRYLSYIYNHHHLIQSYYPGTQLER